MSPPPGSHDGPAVSGSEPATISVLHVDDDSAMVELTADFLHRENDVLDVETETSAAAALDRLDEEAFDCVVSDLDMPGTNGIELLRAVRADDDDLPFILFTGKGSEEVASEAISAGVTDYLQKESGTEQYAVLANRIENAVDQYRTQQALERERTRRSALFENTPDPILETEFEDDELIVRDVNPAFEESFGRSADDIVGRTVAESLIPAGSETQYEDLRSRVLEGDAVETTVSRDTADGPREFRLRAIPVSSREGAPDGDYAWYTDVTERKRRERRLNALRNAFPDLAFIIDEDGRHIDLLTSPASESLLYTDPGGIVGERFYDVFPTDRADEFLSVIRTTLETNAPQTIEYELDVRAGTRWLEARTAPLSTEIDGKRAVTWVSRDVTDRKERERALRALHDIATGITRDDTVAAVCRRTIEAAEDILRFDRCVINIEEGGELPVVAHSSDLSASETTTMSIEEGLAGKTYRTGESFVVDDVQTIDVAKPQGPYGGAISVPVGDRGVFQAVTEETGTFDGADLELAELLVSHAALAIERLENLRSLRRNQRRFEAVFDNPLSLIGLVAPDGTLIDANRTAVDVIGQPAEDIVGQPLWETPWWSHSAEQRAELREWVSRAVAGEYVRFEGEHRGKNGGAVIVDGVLHPVEDDDGDLSEIMIAARDVTDAKERERELERQNERLDEFASIVSHDLRSPLNVIQGSLELAEESGDPAHFERCRSAADRMETLVVDLLTLAREGSTIDELEAVDLAAVAESSWRSVETGGASLQIDTEATVRADRSRLRQLLENLFRNAIEHGGETVDVSVGTLDAERGFYVEDDGPGVPPEERDRVFESGYSGRQHGTGFGLSIGKQIVEAHDWSVRVTEGRDGGARFEIGDVEFV